MELGTVGIGVRGELVVAEWFLRRGYPVYTPLVDVGADLVVDLGGRFLRVQVKSCDTDEDSHVFQLCRRVRGEEHCWAPYEGGVDWYALCWIRKGYIGMVPAGGALFVRVTPGSQKSKEMEIEVVMDRLLKEE